MRLPNNPTQWSKFRRLYFAELEQSPAAMGAILRTASKGALTHVYAAHKPVFDKAIAHN